MVSGGMNSKTETVFAEDPPAVVLGELEISTLHGDALSDATDLLNEEHYLGAGRPVGRTLVQAVHHHGRWVALFVWGPAALKLADRDAAIGWTDSQRAERIGLVVQNRRFLVLAKTRMPNLASRALGLAVGTLPEAWERLHGFRPLLAETFTDIEQFEGTCYKASGWHCPAGRAQDVCLHPALRAVAHPETAPLAGLAQQQGGHLPPRPELLGALQPALQNEPP